MQAWPMGANSREALRVAASACHAHGGPEAALHGGWAEACSGPGERMASCLPGPALGLPALPAPGKAFPPIRPEAGV